MKSYLNKSTLLLVVFVIAGTVLNGCNNTSRENGGLDRIDSLMHAAIQNHAFPGAVVAVGHGSKLVKLQGYGHYGYGKNWNQTVTPQTQYDLASLTKVIATTTAVMQLYEAGKIHLDDKVAQFFPKFSQNEKAGTTIRQLLTHSSGLRPDISLDGLNSRRGAVNRIMEQKLIYKPDSKVVYSDLNFILLAMIVEKVTGQKFAAYCEQHIFKPLGMNHTRFYPISTADTTHIMDYKGSEKPLIVLESPDTTHIAPTGSKSNIPATERTEADTTGGDLFWGVVNDPTSRLMGGVAGHAGLFSTASDLAKLAFMYLHNGTVNGKQFLKASTIKLFTTKYSGIPNSYRALGWDTVSDGCSCGNLFGPKSFGHTGFTGTMVWFDPQQDLFGILLTNQVFPNGHGTKIYSVRRQFENLVYSSLVDSSQTQQY